MITTTEQMLWQSVRYALGRMSYAVGMTCDEVIRLWPELSEEGQRVIKSDVEEAFERDGRFVSVGTAIKALGMEQDRKQWERVRALWTVLP